MRFLPRSSGANWIGAILSSSKEQMRKKSKKFRFHASEKGELAKLQIITSNPPRFTCCLSIPKFHTDLSERKSLRIFFGPQKKRPVDVVATRHLKEMCMECDALEIACGISSHLMLRLSDARGIVNFLGIFFQGTGIRRSLQR